MKFGIEKFYVLLNKNDEQAEFIPFVARDYTGIRDTYRILTSIKYFKVIFRIE